MLHQDRICNIKVESVIKVKKCSIKLENAIRAERAISKKKISKTSSR